MHTKILRYGSSPMGTFGELELWNDMEKVFTCYTVERPWLNNTPFKSCIPAGNYSLEEHSTKKYPKVYAIVGGTVSHFKDDDFDRSACLFHTANRARNVVGCIGLGKKLGALSNEWAVTTSRTTVNKYCKLLKSSNEQLTLSIEWQVIS